jgi:hypothetical protein
MRWRTRGHVLATFKTQQEAIDWSNNHAPLVARVRPTTGEPPERFSLCGTAFQKLRLSLQMEGSVLVSRVGG